MAYTLCYNKAIKMNSQKQVEMGGVGKARLSLY
jgi:hypothetical protein